MRFRSRVLLIITLAIMTLSPRGGRASTRTTCSPGWIMWINHLPYCVTSMWSHECDYCEVEVQLP
jgi:hypothetical protein